MSALRPILIAAVCTIGLAGNAKADGVSVQMDNAKVITFDEPVATLYLGNPSVADLTLIDSRHAFLLGKKFGVTNLIGLSANKRIIVDEPVTVSSRGWGMVTIYRGDNTFNYTCSSLHCETQPVPGDPKMYFDNTESAAGEHEDTASRAAGSAAGSSSR